MTAKPMTPFTGSAKSLAPLSLAFIGDGVYELLVRGYFIEQANLPTRLLHKKTVSQVTAPAQAAAYNRIISCLTQEEQDILRRGRNAKVQRIPKSASVEEYHKSTAIEALFGYLYLEGNLERIKELFGYILDSIETKE